MKVTLTLYAWWLWPYLTVGAVLFLPLTYIRWRTLAPPKESFWADTQGHFRRHGPFGSLWRIAVIVVLWPVAVWEEVR